MGSMTRSVFFLPLLALVAASALGREARGANPGCVAVVGDSDLHGSLEPFLTDAVALGGEAAGPAPARLRYGGIVAVAGYLEILRARFGSRLVFVSAGDLYQGTLASNLSRGRAVVAAFGALGLQATAIGNHDFDFGPLTPEAPDVQGVLKQRAAEAAFPFLSLNILTTDTHHLITWPGTQSSLLVNAGQRRGGLLVGIIGAAGTDTPTVTRPEFVAGLEFPEPIPLIVAEARQLRARGAELILLTAHFGGKCASLDDPHDLSSCDPDSELFRVLNALPPGTVDVAIGGHTHSHVNHWVNGTLALQGGARGQYLALAEVCTKPTGGIDPARTQIHGSVRLCLDEWSTGGCETPAHEGKSSDRVSGGIRQAQFLGEPVTIPAAITDVLEPYLAEVRDAVNAPLGITLPAPLIRDAGKPRLGDLVAGAMQRAAGSDFAVQNLGGVRTDLPAGPLIYGQVFEVLPFGNQIGVLTLTGVQVERFVRQLITRRDKPPFLAGLTAVARGGGYAVTRTDGAALAPDQRYTLATSDFLVSGGEGLNVVLRQVADGDQTILDATLRDALIDLLRARYPSEAGEAPAAEEYGAQARPRKVR